MGQCGAREKNFKKDNAHEIMEMFVYFILRQTFELKEMLRCKREQGKCAETAALVNFVATEEILKFLTRGAKAKEGQEMKGEDVGEIKSMTDNDFKVLQQTIDQEGLHKFGVGQTVLHWAVLRDLPNIVDILLQNHAAVDLQDKEGQTALHLAVRCMNPRNCRALIAAGANINKQNNSGEVPLDLALKAHDHQTVQLLLEQGALLRTKIVVLGGCCQGSRKQSSYIQPYAATIPRVIAKANTMHA